MLTALFWGGTFVAGRAMAGSIEPFAAAFLRFLVASAVLLPLIRLRRGGEPLPTGRVWVRLAMLGLFGVVLYNTFFFKGLQTVGAGRAAVIIALNPSFIALGSCLFFRERLSGIRATGIVVSLVGALTVISHGRPAQLWTGAITTGDLFILGCVGSWVAYTLLGKTTMHSMSPLLMVTWSSALGTVGLAAAALREGILHHLMAYPPRVWVAIAYLALFGTVLGFVWFYQGVRTLGPTRAGVFINFVPAWSVLLAALTLGERPTLSLAVGLVLVTSGVYLSNKTSRSAPSSPANPPA